MANHTIYDNFVLENKIEDMLATQVDFNNYLTADYSLTENPGMTKKIHVYTASGNVEDLEMGEGNSGDIEVSFSEKVYTVGTTQGKFPYYDEQEMSDPTIIETGVKKLSASMTNDLTAKAIGAMNDTNNIYYGSQWKYDDVVDAIAMYPYEDESGLFLIINPKQKATLRKNLRDSLQYVEANVRTGYIGTVCGAVVVESKAVPEGRAFLGTKEAVTAFIKKGVEVEQERIADTRKNTIFARKVMLIALTDETRMIRLSSVADPRTGYTILTSKPADWDTTYGDYFVFDKDDDEMKANTETTFVANKFYSEDTE